jgi:hypothetical protein
METDKATENVEMRYATWLNFHVIETAPTGHVLEQSCNSPDIHIEKRRQIRDILLRQ